MARCFNTSGKFESRCQSSNGSAKASVYVGWSTDDSAVRNKLLRTSALLPHIGLIHRLAQLIGVK